MNRKISNTSKNPAKSFREKVIGAFSPRNLGEIKEYLGLDETALFKEYEKRNGSNISTPLLKEYKKIF